MTTKLERLNALCDQMLNIVDLIVEEATSDEALTEDQLDEIVALFARILAGVMWTTNSEDRLPEWSKYLAYCLEKFVTSEDDGVLIH